MSRPDPLTMTLDELRDWMRDTYCEVRAWYWCRKSDGKYVANATNHPYPPTLDGAHAAMPEGVRWERSCCPTLRRWEWRAYVQVSWQDSTGSYTEWKPVHFNGWPLAIPDSNDPKTDLYRLAVACCMAEDERRDQEVKL